MDESRNRWVLAVVALVFAVVLSAVAYNAGLSQGAAQVAATASANAGAQPAPVPPPYPYPYAYGWHRPWGGGFFPLIPLVFIFFFWIVCFRWFAWGGPWRWRHYYGGPHRGPYDQETFDEWHRRAHDQMKS